MHTAQTVTDGASGFSDASSPQVSLFSLFPPYFSHSSLSCMFCFFEGIRIRKV